MRPARPPAPSAATPKWCGIARRPTSPAGPPFRNASSSVHRHGCKPGGTLIYCVCSLEPEEGEAQARWLAGHPDFAADPIRPDELPGLAEAVTAEGFVRTRPGMRVPGEKAGTLDGFFVARFKRR